MNNLRARATLLKFMGRATAITPLMMMSSAIAAPPTAPSLATGQSFLPYVFGSLTYDSNLFRVSGSQEATQRLGTHNTADMIRSAGVGFKYELPISLQTFKFDGSIARQDYQRFHSLNHNKADADATWAWEVGRLWSGTLKLSYFHDISSFNQLQQAVKDTRNGRQAYFDADYNFIPDWDAIFGGKWRSINHDKIRTLNIRESTGFVGLHYRTTRNSFVGTRATYTHARLPNPTYDNGLPVNNDYNQQAYDLVAQWTADTGSYIRGRVGLTERQLVSNSQRNFTGITGLLQANIEMTDQTSLLLTAMRQPESLNDQITTYAVATGGQAGVQWSITPKIKITNTYNYEEDDFRDNIGLPNTTPGVHRIDKVTYGTLNVNYQALYNLDIILKLEIGNRESNIASARYHYTQVFTGVSYGF